MALRKYYTTWNFVGAVAATTLLPLARRPIVARSLRASTLAVALVGFVVTCKGHFTAWKSWTVSRAQAAALEIAVHQAPAWVVWWRLRPSSHGLAAAGELSVWKAHAATFGIAGAYYLTARPLPYKRMSKRVPNACLGFGALALACGVDAWAFPSRPWP